MGQAMSIQLIRAARTGCRQFNAVARLGEVQGPELAVMRVGVVAALCASAMWKYNKTLHRIMVPLMLTAAVAMFAVMYLQDQ